MAIDAQELALAHSLAEKWRDLYVFARTKDLRLAKVKEDFRAVTTEQSEAFQEELKELRTQFYSDGPIAGVTGGRCALDGRLRADLGEVRGQEGRARERGGPVRCVSVSLEGAGAVDGVVTMPHPAQAWR